MPISVPELPAPVADAVARWEAVAARAEDEGIYAHQILTDFRYETLLDVFVELRHRTTGVDPEYAKAAIEISAHDAATDALSRILQIVEELRAAAKETGL